MPRHVFEDDNSVKAVPDGPQAFVTGWPVWQSRSPLIHGAWLAELGLPGRYQRIGVPPEEIEDFFLALSSGPFVGGNVTAPHKEAAFRTVGRRDRAAEAIGAVNTLWIENGILVGGNTDAYGFAANLDERLAGWSEAEEALVLGAGGAARAVVHALLERGVKRVSILNRTPGRAVALAAAFGPRAAGHGEDERAACLARADLLVNTVPVPPRDPEEERFGFPVKLPDLEALPDHALVTDIVYLPPETPTLAAAKARGLNTADGLGMLLHQAVPGFERWFGARPAVDAALRARILADIAGTAPAA